jgi:hypothetical protein
MQARLRQTVVQQAMRSILCDKIQLMKTHDPPLTNPLSIVHCVEQLRPKVLYINPSAELLFG